MYVEPTAHIPVSEILDSASHGAGPGSSLAQQFKDAMHSVGAAQEHSETSLIGEVLHQQDAAMRELVDRSDALLDHAKETGDVSMVDQMEIMQAITTSNFRFHACVGIAQTVKSGVQTLMKNQ
jgi:type III secretion system HrpB2-like protein